MGEAGGKGAAGRQGSVSRRCVSPVSSFPKRGGDRTGVLQQGTGWRSSSWQDRAVKVLIAVVVSCCFIFLCIIINKEYLETTAPIYPHLSPPFPKKKKIGAFLPLFAFPVSLIWVIA